MCFTALGVRKGKHLECETQRDSDTASGKRSLEQIVEEAA